MDYLEAEARIRPQCSPITLCSERTKKKKHKKHGYSFLDNDELSSRSVVTSRCYVYLPAPFVSKLSSLSLRNAYFLELLILAV